MGEIDQILELALKKGDFRVKLLQGHGGEPWDVKRKAYRTHIPHVTLSMYGTIQDATLSKYGNTCLYSSGLLDRIIFIPVLDLGPDPDKIEPVSDKSKDFLSMLTKKLVDIPMKSLDHGGESQKLYATDAAKRLLEIWNSKTAYMRWASKYSERYAKHFKQIASVAITLHVFKAIINGTDYLEDVSEETMAKAIAIGEWMMCNQVYVFENIFNGGLKTASTTRNAFYHAVVKDEAFIKQNKGRIATTRLVDLIAEDIPGFCDRNEVRKIAKSLGMKPKDGVYERTIGGKRGRGFEVSDELIAKAKAAVKMAIQGIDQ